MIILVAGLVFLILVLNEVWWRKAKPDSELSRKLVHISVGSFVAFWPFILSYDEIRLLSLIFLIVVAASKYLHIFKAIHSVQRPTWGELYFAVAVGAVTFISSNKWVYAAALLQMSLADGLAAVIGVSYGRSSRYEVFSQTKSLVGSLTFLVVSLSCLVAFVHYSGTYLDPGLILAIAIGATAIENVAVKGLDNLLVPTVVAIILQSCH